LGLLQSIPNYNTIVWGSTFQNSLEALMVVYRVQIRIILKQYYNENNSTNELFKILLKKISINNYRVIFWQKSNNENVMLMENLYKINNAKINMNEGKLLLIIPQKYYNNYNIFYEYSLLKSV